jgi:hypothetical protein
MTIYCVFKEYLMNPFQSQYVLYKVFSKLTDAENYVNTQYDTDGWCIEKHEVE